VLRHTDGNRTAASKILGISRVTLIAKIKQHKLDI
jgi:DNA-binding protein Fis